ncbi:SDR family NAD(P)-dependent oxidoreductase [Schleiferilactobacillus perolens]|uniref:Uncharacterized protein n=1 Tax=Schleiferilactobacillus perolens DSM 12744 TaxID=1423792 RepID=A0A0R1NAB7_9LACO|nr:SDR family NAD(P)-dependent oxidoreductase [Schleiferilactobacillus perolens]KRL13368.1 hypothetical protein FD09_GL002199 [Schleiferilactobacillus perolens DSM 12744]
MKRIAVISGTTSGLGRQYVPALISEYPAIDEIWMIARREERLQEIQADYPDMNFKIIPLDLTLDESYTTLEILLAEEKPHIYALINNAGVAFNGDVADVPLKYLIAMCNLNVKGTTALTRLCLPYIQKGGFILNVSSASSFAPNPHMDVYSATKAYIASFSYGLREELRPAGINVCTALPGRMKTEMDQKLNTGKREGVFNLVPSLDVPLFAHRTVRAAMAGKGSYTMNWFYKTYRVVAKILPTELIVHFSAI